MGIGESLKQAYFAVEDQYYAVMDFFDQKIGLPVYKFFVDPIENNGVPSFPFALLLLALATGGAFLLLSPSAVDLTVTVKSAEGVAIQGATVTAFVGGAEGETQVSSPKGEAVFKGIPVGAKIYFAAEAVGFNSTTTKDIVVAADTIVPAIRLSAKPIVPPSYSLSVLVKDAAGNYLEDVSVSISGKNGAELVSLRTNGRGSAALSFSTNDSVVQISAQKDGFDSSSKQVSTSASYTEISLSPKPKAPQEELVPIIVRVRNATDGFVEAKVTLYDSYGGELDSKSTFKTGQVAINVSQGREFTIGAVAIGSDENNYLQFVNRTEMTAAKGMGAVKIVLSRKTPSSTGIIEAKVLDEQADNAGRLLPLKNADVSWFLLGGAPTTTKLGANKTNSDGIAFFELEKTLSTYATAYLSGYLPGVFPFMKAGDKQNVSLKKLAAGNNGAVEVTVKEVDGSAAEGASVKLFYEEGFFAGYPDKRTDADGKVVFPNVSVVGNFHAIATIGSRQGKSSDFSVPISEKPLKVKITLEPTVGTFVVSAKDRYEGTAVSPATVSAMIGGTKAAGCTIAAGADACEVVVQSNVDVELVVNATGYVSYSSGAVQVGTDDSKAFEAKLLPERFNTLGIFFDGLKNPAGSAVTAIDKASYYDAVFTVNFPANASNAAGGFYVRVGKVGVDRADADSEEQKFVITGFESVGTQPQKSTSFGSSCDNDLLKSESDNGWYRFVQYNFQPQGTAKMFSGSRQYAIRVFSKPSAFAGERMQLDYRAFLVINNESYVRDPVDPDLGDKEKTESKDSCLAETNNAKFDVVDGGLECNDKACIGISFADGTRNYGNYYQTTVDSIFSTNFTVKLLSPISNPVVRISSPGKHAKFYAYNAQGSDNSSGNADGAFDLQIAIPISENANGGIVSKAVLPASPTEVLVELFDGPTKVIEKTGILSIQGTGKLTVTASPKKIGAGNETNLVVKVVATESGKLVEEGEVSIVQDDATQPFGQDVPATIVGGSFDSFGQGSGGEYTFEAIKPVTRGDFQVVAKAEGFAEASDSVKVLASQVLEVTPLDLQGCVAREEIKLRNLLNLNAQITVSTSDCAKLTNKNNAQPPYTYPSFTFTLEPQAAPYSYYLEPINYNTTCPIDVAARATDGSYSYSRIFYKTCDKDVTGKFLKANPSELKNTVPECDSARTLTLSNNAIDLVQTGVQVPILVQADGLDLQKGCGSNGGNLKTPITISQTPGGSCSLSFKPNAAGKEKNISITFKSSLLGGFSDSITVPFSNCAKPPTCPSDAALPEIVSTAPSGTINTLFADLSIRTSESSTCRFDYDANVEYKDMQFDTDGLLTKTHSKKFVPDSSHAFQEGSNTLYANCINCNGKPMDESTPITFTYAKPTQPPQCPGAPGCDNNQNPDINNNNNNNPPVQPVADHSVPLGGKCTEDKNCPENAVCKDGTCAPKDETTTPAGADNTITFTFNDQGVTITQGGKPVPDNTVNLGVSSIIPRTALKVIVENKASKTIEGVDARSFDRDCFDLTTLDDLTKTKVGFSLEKDKSITLLFSFASPKSERTKNNFFSCAIYSVDEAGNIIFKPKNQDKTLSTELQIYTSAPQYNNAPKLKVNVNKIDSDVFTLLRAPYDAVYEEFVTVDDKAPLHLQNPFGAYYEGAPGSGHQKLDLVAASNILLTDANVVLKDGSKLEGGKKPEVVAAVLALETEPVAEKDPVESKHNNFIFKSNANKDAEGRETQKINISFGSEDKIAPAVIELKKEPPQVLPFKDGDKTLTRKEIRKKLKDSIEAVVASLRSSGIEDWQGKLGIVKSGSIYVASQDGGVTRILKFAIDENLAVTGEDDAPVDEITSDYEFKDKYAGGVIEGTYAPPLVQFAAPGQKWFTVFGTCKGDDQRSGGSGSLKNTVKSCLNNVFDDRKIEDTYQVRCESVKDKGEKSGCLNELSESQVMSKSDLYCNDASGKIENNPRLCCKGRGNYSLNGNCIGETNDKGEVTKLKQDCVLTADSRVVYLYLKDNDGKKEVKYAPEPVDSENQVHSTNVILQWQKGTDALELDSDGVYKSNLNRMVLGLAAENTCNKLDGSNKNNCKKCFVGSCESLSPSCGEDRTLESCRELNYLAENVEEKYTPFALLNPGGRWFYVFRSGCSLCNLEDNSAEGILRRSLLGYEEAATPKAKSNQARKECTPHGVYAEDKFSLLNENGKEDGSGDSGKWSCTDIYTDPNNYMLRNLATGIPVNTSSVDYVADYYGSLLGTLAGSGQYLRSCDTVKSILENCFKYEPKELNLYRGKDDGEKYWVDCNNNGWNDFVECHFCYDDKLTSNYCRILINDGKNTCKAK